jgi:hypothetical protein
MQVSSARYIAILIDKNGCDFLFDRAGYFYG